MYSLLYVDDEPELLEIGKLFLENTGDFTVIPVLSAGEGLARLGQQDFDAIISDYQMPEMDGIDFLKNVRKSCGNIPFILFTGRGREEVIIQAINNGVDFYLQKGGDPKAQFAELGHKIHQAVSRRRAERALSDSEKRFADIINFLPDATFAIDTRGKVITWNKAIEEMTGISAEEILGKGDFEYSLPFYGKRRPILIDLIFERDEGVLGFYSNIRRDGNTLSAETNLPHPKGTPIYVLAKASPLFNKEGKITGAIEAIRDITDRKKSEEILLSVNEQLSASGEELRAQYDELAETEKRIRDSESRLNFIIGFYEYARKSEKELLDYAVEGAGIVTSSPLAYLAFLNDDESELSMYAWSKSAMKECSMRVKPIVYKTEKTGLWGEAVRQRRPVITNDYEAPDPKKRGYPEGHPRIIRHMNVPVMEGGHVVIVAGVANKSSDYTENDTRELLLLMQGLWNIIKRKRAEQTGRESEGKYRTIIEHSPVGMHFYELLPDGSLVFTGGNPGADTILGIRHGEFIGKTLETLFPDLVNTEAPAQYRRVATEGGTWQNDQVAYDAGKVHRAYSVTAFQISPGRMVAMFMDITGSKRTETELRNAYERVAVAEEELHSQFDELTRNERDLRKSEAEISGIFQAAPVGIAVVADRVLQKINERLCTITGYPRDELEGRNTRFLYLNDIDYAAAGRMREEAYRGSAPDSIDIQWKRRDGVVIDVQIRAAPVDRADPNAPMIYSALDVTEKIRDHRELAEAYRRVSTAEEELRTNYNELAEAQAELKSRKQQMEEIAATVPGVVYQFYVRPDGSMGIYFTSSRVTEFIGTGKSLEESFPAFVDGIAPDDRGRFIESIHDVVKSAAPWNFTGTFIKPSGETIWFQAMSNPVKHGDELVFSGVILDITKRKTTEAALRESEERYRLLVENTHDLIYTITAEGILTFVSPSWTSLFGHVLKDVTGAPFQRFVHPDDVPACKAALAEVVSSKKRVSGVEYRVFHADGSIRIHTSTVAPIFNDAGEVVSYVGNARDITEMKQFQNAIKESSRKLNLLTSITRHDVANQLTVVEGYTQLAALRKPDPLVMDFLAKISSAIETIQHQFEFARAYQDMGTQSPAWFQVGDVIRSGRPSQITLDCTCGSTEVFADPMIGKVFFNLFDNAVRYGECVTTVTVRCGIVEGELVITFADNGVGIPLDEKQKVFEKGFGRHTGFGLFLAREILAITGISITETGSHGKGATFEITVPKGTYRSVPE
ncbi:MAG: PAS domain S-box protein [Methanoregula sp.]|jgi:PAS domain S-box-containing protein|nr:PAS domain S-box protein [Methanoregula sp.]